MGGNIGGTGLHKTGDRCSEWMGLQLKEGCLPKSHKGLQTTVKHGGDILPSSGLNNLCSTIREECSRVLNVCCSMTGTLNVSVGGTDPGSQHCGTSLGLHEEAEGFQEACSHRRPAVGSPWCWEQPCWEDPSQIVYLKELRLFWRQRVVRPTRAWV